MRIVILALLVILLISLASCIPQFEPTSQEISLIEWVYADLRALDPSDTGISTQDVIAAYVRHLPERERFQIRLDFLDLTTLSDLDIYIAIDHAPGGLDSLSINAAPDIFWDTLIIIPQSKAIQVLDSSKSLSPNMSARVFRDPILDTITIEFDARSILEVSPLGFHAQVFTTSSNSLTLGDRTHPFHSSSEPPAPVQLLLAFWNTFPAYTPAQSLRRWDGAHTGPNGGRHGLYNLLRVSRNQGIPIALMDLKYPPSLSALDYAGGMSMVEDLAKNGLLILPEIIPIPNMDEPANAKSAITPAGHTFNLPNSPFLFTPYSDEPQKGYPIIFARGPDLSDQSVSITRQGQSKVISLPKESQEQATPHGPTLDVRRALIDTAIRSNEIYPEESKPLLVLGGDLPNSTWGDPASARATMRYIVGHPWIWPMKADDLLSAQPTSIPQSQNPLQPTMAAPDFQPLPLNLPDSPISEAAWNTYLSLFAPLTNMPTEIQDLRSIYKWQVDALLAAAQWDADPKPIASCDIDVDGDGSPECILASRDIYTHFEPKDGSLVFAFSRTGTGTHQFIGPSSQFIVGASDPSTWDLSRGSSADPSVIPGAFTDGFGPYQVTISDNQIEFRSNTAVKTYQLTEDGFHLKVQGPAATQFQVPLVVDPWLRFNPGWGERYTGNMDGDYTWEIVANKLCQSQQHEPLEPANCPTIKILVESNVDLTPFQFNSTRDRMGQPENPNFEYPTGHYLPFPLSLIQVNNTSNLNFNISVQP